MNQASVMTLACHSDPTAPPLTPTPTTERQQMTWTFIKSSLLFLFLVSLPLQKAGGVAQGGVFLCILTSFCEGLFCVFLNSAEQFPSLHAENTQDRRKITSLKTGRNAPTGVMLPIGVVATGFSCLHSQCVCVCVCPMTLFGVCH